MARAKRGTKKVEVAMVDLANDLIAKDGLSADEAAAAVLAVQQSTMDPKPEQATEPETADVPAVTEEQEAVVEGEGTSQVEEETPRPVDACDSYPDCSPESAECSACFADFPECFAVCERETKRKHAPRVSSASRTSGRKGKSARVATGPVIVSGYGTNAGSLRSLYAEYVTMGMTNEQMFTAMIDGFRTRYPDRKGLDEAGFEKWVRNRIKGQAQWLRARQKKSDTPAPETQDAAVNE